MQEFDDLKAEVEVIKTDLANAVTAITTSKATIADLQGQVATLEATISAGGTVTAADVQGEKGSAAAGLPGNGFGAAGPRRPCAPGSVIPRSRQMARPPPPNPG